jgi:hypothetical protein
VLVLSHIRLAMSCPMFSGLAFGVGACSVDSGCGGGGLVKAVAIRFGFGTCTSSTLVRPPIGFLDVSFGFV